MRVLKPSLSLSMSPPKNIDVVVRSVTRMADFLQGGLLTERAAQHTLPEEEVTAEATSPPDAAGVINAHGAAYAVASGSLRAKLAPAAETSLTEVAKSIVEGRNGESDKGQPGHSDLEGDGGGGQESTVSVADVTPW